MVQIIEGVAQIKIQKTQIMQLLDEMIETRGAKSRTSWYWW